MGGKLLFGYPSILVGQLGFWGAPPSIVPLMNSTPVAGEGELLKNALGDDSWLVTMAERGEASREPEPEAEVVNPFIDCITECCLDVLVLVGVLMQNSTLTEAALL
jgi:hypothetical protein